MNTQLLRFSTLTVHPPCPRHGFGRTGRTPRMKPTALRACCIGGSFAFCGGLGLMVHPAQSGGGLCASRWGSSRQGCESYGVKVPCRQLPGLEDWHIRDTGR